MSAAAFTLKKVLTFLVLPPTGLVLMILAGLALQRRHPRSGAALAWCAALTLLALSFTPVSALLVSLIAVPSAVLDPSTAPAQAIVIVSGDTRLRTPEYGDTVGPHTLERLRYGARLARAQELPLLVSGGAPAGGTPDAQLMQGVLLRDFGLTVRYTEASSRDTHENAVRCAQILRPAGIRRVWLVTDDTHMRRALDEFTRAGLEPLAAPVSTADFAHRGVLEWMPTIGALNESTQALHEIAGELALSLRR